MPHTHDTIYRVILQKDTVDFREPYDVAFNHTLEGARVAALDFIRTNDEAATHANSYPNYITKITMWEPAEEADSWWRNDHEGKRHDLYITREEVKP